MEIFNFTSLFISSETDPKVHLYLKQQHIKKKSSLSTGSATVSFGFSILRITLWTALMGFAYYISYIFP